MELSLLDRACLVNNHHKTVYVCQDIKSCIPQSIFCELFPGMCSYDEHVCVKV